MNIKKCIFIISVLLLCFLSSCNNKQNVRKETMYYDVHFNTNGGSEIASIKVEEGKTIQKPSAPQKLGYYFVGWYYDFECTILYNFDTKMNRNMTLYAAWETMPISIIVNLDNQNSEKQNLNYQDTIANLNVPNKKGYRFVGYYFDEKLTQKIESDYCFLQDSTIWCKWEIVKYEIEIVIDETTKQTQFVEYGSTIKNLQQPSKENHIFNGFYLDSDCKNPINEENLIDKNLTIYVKWIDIHAIPYKVVYKGENIADDKYSIIETNVLYGSLNEEVVAPIKTYEGLEVISSDVKGQIVLDGSLVLEVLYRRKTYEVTYIIHGEEYEKVTDLKYNTKYKLIDNVMLKGYIFRGWYVDDQFKKVASLNQIPSHDTIVYGKLEPITVGSSGLSYVLNPSKTGYTISGYTGTETEIIIPNGYNCLPVVAIDCYFDSENIQKITIGKNIQEIKEDAFIRCLHLETIWVESENAKYYSEDGVLYDKSRNSLKVYPLGKKDTSFYIPSNILVLERFCFHANSYLENLIINDNLTTIHSEALRGCTNLKTISIGKGVSFISDTWVNACYHLEMIYVDLDNPFYKDQNGVLFDSSGESLLHFPASNSQTFYVIDHNVKKINYHAFDSCLQLQYVVIPTSVDVIEYQAFVDASFTIYFEGFQIPKNWHPYAIEHTFELILKPNWQELNPIPYKIVGGIE